MAQNEHKRGDTWNYIGYAGIQDFDGKNIDLTGWLILAQARDQNGKLIAEFACAWIDPAQQTYNMRAQTSAWPVASLWIDVQFTAPSGDVISSPTVQVSIVKDVTQ